MKPKTVSEMYPDPWLKADDLNGRSCILTIQAIAIEQFNENPNNPKSDKVWKAVLDFGRTKRLILNKTQVTAVSEIAQTETFAEWTGTRLTLQPARTHNSKPTIAITPAPALTASVPNPMLLNALPYKRNENVSNART